MEVFHESHAVRTSTHCSFGRIYGLRLRHPGISGAGGTDLFR